MRFLADENVSRLVVERLQADGHDVFSVAKSGRGASDDHVVEMAKADGRILITEDRDFGELIVRQRLGVAGVMLLELDRLSTAAEADRVGNVVSTHQEKLVGNLVVIEPARLRLRGLE
jgi:predicted nuclease of predicted toxin-antitoxin system